jgi:hypothetical protein
MSTLAERLRDINAFVIDLHPSRPSDHTVWVVTADTFESGYGDLDNRTTVVAVFATLDAAARDLPVLMAKPGERFFHPIITQTAVVS